MGYRRSLLVVVAVLAGLPAPLAAAQEKRPNILFIFTDDQSWRTLSCYKDEGAWPWVKTPHIDRLAREGLRFRHAYGAAWCAPSRACVLTGLYPHGIQGLQATDVHRTTYDRKVCKFWPAALRRAGYHTALIGKWHLGTDTGHGRDWDHSVVWDQAQSRGDQYHDQFLSIDGAPRKEAPGYSTDLYTQFALDYLQRDHKKPWFLWLCYNAPHMSWGVAERHKDRYRDAEVPIPGDIFGPRANKPGYVDKLAHWQRGPAEQPPLHARTKQSLPEMVRDYNRTICAVDEGVGRIYAALEKSGQLDNTLIVFTSDQGFAWGEHGFATKVGPYDACLRVPLVVRYPGRVVQGRVCPQPATVVDLPPTILGVAGVELPWKMHGRDLAPLFKEPQANLPAPALMEHFQWQYGPATDRALTGRDDLNGIPWWLLLRHGKYKYIRTLVDDEIEELYDLDADPQELKNLTASPDHRDLVADQRRQLLAELRRTNAKLVEHLPTPRQLADRK